MEVIVIPHSSVHKGSPERMTTSGPTLDPSGAATQVLPRMAADASLPLGQPGSKIKIPYAALQHLLAFVDASLIILASVVGRIVAPAAVGRPFSREKREKRATSGAAPTSAAAEAAKGR